MTDRSAMELLGDLVGKLDGALESFRSKISDEPGNKRRRIDHDADDRSNLSEEDPDGDIDAMPLEEFCGDEGTQSFFPVSEPTKALLQMSFCKAKPADNKTRKVWLAKVGSPAGDETRCPKLDSVVKSQLKKDVVENDRKLSRLQNFTLDAAGPFVAALEEATTEDGSPNLDLIVNCLQQGLVLLGNASSHFSHERRLKILENLNPDLKSLAEDEDYSKAPPFLFGKGFEKLAKDRADAVQCLRKATSSSSASGKPYFRASRPHYGKSTYGGGGSGQNQFRRSFQHYPKNNQRSFGPKNGTNGSQVKKTN